LGLLQEFQIPVSVAGPQEVAEAIQKECATSESFTLRVDGFVGMLLSSGLHLHLFWGVKISVVVVPGVNFMFYDDFWRTSYLREIPCPKA
jgi:hypothetical protein